MKTPYQILIVGIAFFLLQANLMGQSDAAQKVQRLDELYERNYKKGDIVAAEFNLLEGLEIRKKELGNNHPITLDALATLAGFYQKTGQLEDAERIYNRLLSLAKQVYREQDKDLVGIIYNTAVVYNDLGEYERALDLYTYLEELCLEHFGKEHAAYAYALEGLATTYYNLERYGEAESCYKEVLTIQEKLSGTSNAKFAFTLSNLASVYQAKNKNKEAIKLIKQALFIQKKTLDKEDKEYANSLNTLAVLYTKLERYDDAEAAIKEGLTIMSKKIGNEHPWYLIAQSTLVSLWIRKGAYEQAEQLCLDLNQKQAKLLGKKHPFYINTLGLTAKIYRDKQQLDLALKYIMQALNATFSDYQQKLQYSERFIRQIPTIKYDYQLKINHIYEILSSILYAYYKSTEDKKWLEQRHEVIKQVIVLNERFRNEFTFETDKYTVLNTVATFIKLGMESCLELMELGGGNEYKEAAFWFAEQNKSMLLLDALRSKQKHHFGGLPDSLVQQERSLQKQKSILQKELLEATSPTNSATVRANLNQLNNQINQFKRTLKKAYPKYFQTKYGQALVSNTTKEIQAMLEPQTTLLAYFVADSITYLFTLTSDQLNVIPLAVAKEKLKENVAVLHKALSDYHFILSDSLTAWKSYTTMASWFYQEMVEPGIRGLEGIQQLIVIPDYELGHLPFEVFLKEPPTQKGYKNLSYLLKDYRISYNYSATLWKENKSNLNWVSNGEVLACASSYGKEEEAKLFEKRGRRLGQLRKTLKPLPAVQKEVKGIAATCSGDFLEGIEANEAFFKKNASNYGIIHLAMHGILNQDAPILSSLAFSENLATEEDNFLHAYEISQLDLNAQLVVLSACETGVGKFEQGEGVLSLARSFMYAGVPSLVVSLWQVHDFSTALLMQDFYANLMTEMNKAEALRQAKMTYMDHAKGITAHPAFWSAFIPIGDSSPIVQESPRLKLWWGILVLVLIVFFWKKYSSDS
ncbi:CHAT domain-containing protein [Aureispira anguillae]|uniref:CHAT domain-containing protein n=1 Tax=Aureispira anguillae TaxID=2864201 RepID=A0A916DVT5_9BACT|nr:CHAT domain-containing tetratricopeptide repeat protein [Aureispira anguillae]BDS14067.1 CHAT domain-containing protein [Aureispira anguillae]